MERVDNKTVGFEFSVEPFKGCFVGGHGDLSEHVLTSSGEICGIEHNLIVFEAEFESFSLSGTLFFSQF
jgi:hypothetical protein